MKQYVSWVFENVVEPKNKCREVTLEMQKFFPELIRVRGFYEDTFYGKRPHWWLKTTSGEIVDPTVQQLSDVRVGEISGHESQYSEMDEENPITGRCPNCGDYSRNHRTCCSDECSIEFGAYINGIN
jgi:hypothetical protein